MLRRALDDPAVQGGEASIAGHLRRLDSGDRRFVGLPVFPLRNFTARDLYVRKDGPVKTPADLPGRRIGMYDWVASGSIWYRHFLRFIEVPPESLEWWIGDIDTPRAPTHLYTLPKGVHRPPEGRSLSEMLIAGELDALYSPPRPRHYDPIKRTHHPPLSRHPVDRARLLPADRLLPAPAPCDPAPRRLGAR